MNNKKICWVTATYFLDVDIPIIKELSDIFDIDWIVITNDKNEPDDVRYIESQCGDISYRMEINNHNFISYKTYQFNKRLITMIAENNYDFYYFNVSGFPYFFVQVKKYIDIDRVCIATHNVTTPKGARYYYLAKWYMSFIIRSYKYFHVFSKNQQKVLMSRKNDVKCLYAPLCLKDYGKSNTGKAISPISFLFFGNIIQYKRLDVLLEAANILKEKYNKCFKIKIYGYCPPAVWGKKYEKTIKYPELFDLSIRRIPSGDIPALFESSHYFVMPYQDIAQSGAMTVALNYNLPVIASDLPSFEEFIVDNVTGFFFEAANATDLAEKMAWVIDNHDNIYETLRINQQNFVNMNLSKTSIIGKYKKFIESILYA